MKTRFTSDHHFGHANIIKYCNRPFHGIHDMNVAMEVAWNEVVEPSDLDYYLGDFAMNVKLVPFLVSRLNGIKILIPGNPITAGRKRTPHRIVGSLITLTRAFNLSSSKEEKPNFKQTLTSSISYQPRYFPFARSCSTFASSGGFILDSSPK